MSDRLPSGPSRPEAYATDGSICTGRKITLGTVKGSVNFNAEAKGNESSGNVSQQVPDAKVVATGGSCVNVDEITAEDVTGDLNFSIHAANLNAAVFTGAVSKTIPSAKGVVFME